MNYDYSYTADSNYPAAFLSDVHGHISTEIDSGRILGGVGTEFAVIAITDRRCIYQF